MRQFFFALTVALVVTLVARGQDTPAASLSVGMKAPDFALPYATKDSVGFGELRLSSYAGKNVVLAFYPADWSGGCTREVCSFRDNFAAISDLNAVVLGISGDYTYSHHEWAKALGLPFVLLSDHRHSVASMYYSFNEKTGYNRRTVYIVDAKGAIAYVDMEYSTRDGASFAKLQAALAKLQPAEGH